MPRKFEKKNAVSFAVVRKLTENPDDQVSFQLSRVGKQVSQIPNAIPHRFLADDGEDEVKQARLDASRLKKVAQDAENPHLLPHEYDYDVHMKTRGKGVFISSTNAPIDPENDARDVGDLYLFDAQHSLI